MRIGIIQFPGSSGEREMNHAVAKVGMEPVSLLWSDPVSRMGELEGFILLGGSSYEDQPRAGILAALHPLIQALNEESELGKPILGIGNGAQILVEGGWVPGLENNKLGMALTDNKRVVGNRILDSGLYSATVHIQLSNEYQRNAFTRHLTRGQILSVPISHRQGRFMMEQALWQEIESQGLNVFEYCDEKGNALDYYPINPNGSFKNIAAISNKAGNILAIMPHIELSLAADPFLHSMRDFIAARHKEVTLPLYYYPRPYKRRTYQKPEGSFCVITESAECKAKANAVETFLKAAHINLSVTCYRHWDVHGSDAGMLEKIKESGVLQGEAINPATYPKRKSFLVQPHEDVKGQYTLQQLEEHVVVTGVSAIHSGLLWHFNSEEANMEELIEQVMQMNLLFNPFSEVCEDYIG